MSMELYVFSDHPLRSISQWQQAIIEDGFDILLYEKAVFEELDGFLPMRLDGAGTGVEVAPTDSTEAIEWFERDGFPFEHKWTHALAFCWGGDFRELIVAYSTAASYARATAGIVFDCEEGKILAPKEALDLARKMASDLKNELEPPHYEWNEVQ